MMLTQEEIIQLEYQLIEAIKISDIDFLKRYLHDDLLFMAPNGSIITKEIDLMSHQSKQMQVEQIEPFFEDIRIIEQMAIVIVVYQTKGILLGKPIEGKFRYIRFWKLFSHEAKIIGGSCNQIG